MKWLGTFERKEGWEDCKGLWVLGMFGGRMKERKKERRCEGTSTDHIIWCNDSISENKLTMERSRSACARLRSMCARAKHRARAALARSVASHNPDTGLKP